MTPAERNRREYVRRVNNVLDHIRAHLGDALELDELAHVAAFSPFHFHRVFKTVTGENVGEYIQRLRLEAAASALRQRPHVDILEIALELGFGSASAFARAFKARFGVSATEWRADRKHGQADGNGGEAVVECDRHGDDMPAIEDTDITIVALPSYHVAYKRVTGPYGAGGNIPALWEALARWARARDLWTADRVCLGISHDNPNVTAPDKCRADAAIVIPAGYDPGSDVNVTDIEGGKFAALAFRGTAASIGGGYDRVFRWMPGSGYQPDHRMIFELYRGEPYDPSTNTFRCDICVPVRPL